MFSFKSIKKSGLLILFFSFFVFFFSAGSFDSVASDIDLIGKEGLISQEQFMLPEAKLFIEFVHGVFELIFSTQ